MTTPNQRHADACIESTPRTLRVAADGAYGTGATSASPGGRGRRRRGALRAALTSLALAWLAALATGCENEEALGGGEATDEGGADEGGSTTDSFSTLYAGYFSTCKVCHTPNAPGRTSETEQTLDFSSRSQAYNTITQGTASGLTGNQEGCNGAPFIGDTAGESLILAVVDEDTRANFDLPSHPDCNADSISDMTLKVGNAPSSAFVQSLSAWIEAGAPNN